MAKAKYIVGIDLGTTNIVLSYAPLAAAGGDTPTSKRSLYSPGKTTPNISLAITPASAVLRFLTA